MTAAEVPTQIGSGPKALDLARCLACGRALAGVSRCAGCGREYRVNGGIVDALGPLEGRNKVAAAFYEGGAWARFRPFEKRFLTLMGPGQARARRQILGRLPDVATARVLEVGIGDGENVPLLPAGWDVFGVDIARSLLNVCQTRYPRVSGRLAWAEGEALPFEDATFDAVYTVGGINYFRDPEVALAEMRRVVRPGGTLIAADERPDLHRYGIGHLIGIKCLDAFWLRMVGLDRDFVDMVLSTPPLVEPAARRAWPEHKRVPIWNRLGYCLVDTRRA